MKKIRNLFFFLWSFISWPKGNNETQLIRFVRTTGLRNINNKQLFVITSFLKLPSSELVNISFIMRILNVQNDERNLYFAKCRELAKLDTKEYIDFYKMCLLPLLAKDAQYIKHILNIDIKDIPPITLGQTIYVVVQRFILENVIFKATFPAYGLYQKWFFLFLFDTGWDNPIRLLYSPGALGFFAWSNLHALTFFMQKTMCIDDWRFLGEDDPDFCAHDEEDEEILKCEDDIENDLVFCLFKANNKIPLLENPLYWSNTPEVEFEGTFANIPSSLKFGKYFKYFEKEKDNNQYVKAYTYARWLQYHESLEEFFPELKNKKGVWMPDYVEYKEEITLNTLDRAFYKKKDELSSSPDQFDKRIFKKMFKPYKQYRKTKITKISNFVSENLREIFISGDFYYFNIYQTILTKKQEFHILTKFVTYFVRHIIRKKPFKYIPTFISFFIHIIYLTIQIIINRIPLIYSIINGVFINIKHYIYLIRNILLGYTNQKRLLILYNQQILFHIKTKILLLTLYYDIRHKLLKYDKKHITYRRLKRIENILLSIITNNFIMSYNKIIYSSFFTRKLYFFSLPHWTIALVNNKKYNNNIQQSNIKEVINNFYKDYTIYKMIIYYQRILTNINIKEFYKNKKIPDGLLQEESFDGNKFREEEFNLETFKHLRTIIDIDMITFFLFIFLLMLSFYNLMKSLYKKIKLSFNYIKSSYEYIQSTYKLTERIHNYIKPIYNYIGSIITNIDIMINFIIIYIFNIFIESNFIRNPYNLFIAIFLDSNTQWWREWFILDAFINILIMYYEKEAIIIKYWNMTCDACDIAYDYYFNNFFFIIIPQLFNRIIYDKIIFFTITMSVYILPKFFIQLYLLIYQQIKIIFLSFCLKIVKNNYFYIFILNLFFLILRTIFWLFLVLFISIIFHDLWFDFIQYWPLQGYYDTIESKPLFILATITMAFPFIVFNLTFPALIIYWGIFIIWITYVVFPKIRQYCAPYDSDLICIFYTIYFAAQALGYKTFGKIWSWYDFEFKDIVIAYAQ